VLLKQNGGPKGQNYVHSDIKQNSGQVLQIIQSKLVKPLWAFAQKLYENLLKKESLLVEDG
jgi:hypothetical protein